jgi:F-type H+-transporting ATPase subunit epsilon
MADANAKTFNFELVSPEKILMSEPAWQVTIPGEEGYFGVRAGHTSLIAAVKPGVVEVVKTEGGAVEKIFIAGGFADVTGKNCTLLAEQAMPISDIDAAKTTQELANLNEDLARATDMVTRVQVQNKIKLANAKLHAVQAA